MAYIFIFAKLNIANIENLKREQTPPQIPKPGAIAQISKTKYSWAYIFVQDVPRIHFIMIWAKSNITRQLNKLGLQNWVKPIPTLKPS